MKHSTKQFISVALSILLPFMFPIQLSLFAGVANSGKISVNPEQKTTKSLSLDNDRTPENHRFVDLQNRDLSSLALHPQQLQYASRKTTPEFWGALAVIALVIILFESFYLADHPKE